MCVTCNYRSCATCNDYLKCGNDHEMTRAQRCVLCVTNDPELHVMIT